MHIGIVSSTKFLFHFCKVEYDRARTATRDVRWGDRRTKCTKTKPWREGKERSHWCSPSRNFVDSFLRLLIDGDRNFQIACHISCHLPLQCKPMLSERAFFLKLVPFTFLLFPSLFFLLFTRPTSYVFSCRDIRQRLGLVCKFMTN